MAGPMHSLAAQNFQYFIKTSLVLVDSGPSPAHPLRFLPRHSLKTYLTPKLLRQLGINQSECQAVYTGYTTVFAILFSIDKAIYITRFLPYDHFDDEHLPFQHFEGWPPDCQSFSEQFYNAQWQFHAQTLKKGRLNNTQFLPQAIVPFIRRKVIKEDVVSSTYMVELHPEYDQLTDKVHSSMRKIGSETSKSANSLWHRTNITNPSRTHTFSKLVERRMHLITIKRWKHTRS